MTPRQSEVSLKRHLKELFGGSSSVIVRPFVVPPLLGYFLVKKGRRSLYMMRQVSSETRHL
jgi:hypothetical protein